LLTTKLEKWYKKLIQELKGAALALGLVLNPTILMTDFEQASMNAFNFHFPHIKLSGCFFHLGKSFFRRVVDLGLRTAYSKDQDFKLWVKKFSALALVPKQMVEIAFHQTNPECPVSLDVVKLGEFTNYIMKNYVGDSHSGREPLFPIAIWNHYENDGPRTNNNIEGLC
jgi:hypothetical protein